MRLGVSYIVFDGIELLGHSIEQIRAHVNYVNIIYQETSWFGRKMGPTDYKELVRLKEAKLIDDLIKFDQFNPLRDHSTQSIIKAKSYETKKRQFGLIYCLRQKCTHFLSMDVDEFYVGAEFAKAKLDILRNGWDRTAVRFINYVKTPTLHRGYDSARVPFICKINPTSSMGKSFFVKCDPTRGVANGGKMQHEFSPNLITMHHMETVRKDLLKKYESTTRAIFRRTRTNELVAKIKATGATSKTFDFDKIICPAVKNAKLTPCENRFNIPYQEWK